MEEDLNRIIKCMTQAEELRYSITDIVRNLDESKLNIDSYYCIKAIGSLINNIIGNKIDNIIEIGNKQIKLNDFINTFDKNYLDNMKCLLDRMNRTEAFYCEEALILVKRFICFFDDFTKRMEIACK